MSSVRPSPTQIVASRTSVTLLVALIVTFSNGMAFGQDPRVFFRENCTNCHTIGGGRLTGPDLKGVTERRDRVWLVPFMKDPKGLIDAGDPVAQKLYEDYRTYMTTFPAMTSDLANGLLDLIEEESALEKSEFVGLQMPERDFTAADIALGLSIFTGGTRLLNGGAPCYSCHTVGGLSGLGGGRLGPDLTKVFERLSGRKALAQWLKMPPTVQMKATFANQTLEDEEVFALVGFLQDAATNRDEDQSASMLTFVLLGLGISGLALTLFGSIWKNRFRGVRSALVHGQVAGGTR